MVSPIPTLMLIAIGWRLEVSQNNLDDRMCHTKQDCHIWVLLNTVKGYYQIMQLHRNIYYIDLLAADASPKMVVYTVYLHKYCECVQPI